MEYCVCLRAHAVSYGLSQQQQQQQQQQEQPGGKPESAQADL